MHVVVLLSLYVSESVYVSIACVYLRVSALERVNTLRAQPLNNDLIQF